MGERFAMPNYPPAMTTLTDTMLGPVRWQGNRLTAATLSFVAAVLMIVSTFLPLLSAKLSGGGETYEQTATAWTADVTGFPNVVEVPANGYPMVFGGLILIGATFVCWFAAAPGAAAGTQRVAAMTTAIGSAFVIATAWTVAVQVSNGVESIGLLGAESLGINAEASYRVGFWLMMTAALLALLAGVFALLPNPRPAWPAQQLVDPYVATPPYGFPMPVPPAAPLTPQPMSQSMPQPLTVDPLTGQPVQVDPLTGLPVAPGHFSPPAGMPAAQFGQGPVGPPVGVPIEPIGYEMPPVAQVPHNPPVAPAVPAQGEHSLIPPDQPVAFTQEPVGSPTQEPGNGLPQAPIVLPAPPPQGPPPGPAVPASEDPLADPRQD